MEENSKQQGRCIIDTSLILAEKIAAAAGVGMLIGLEREWAHKEAGVRSFAIAALLGTVSWLVSPYLALIQVGVIVAIIIIVNVYHLSKQMTLEITTSLALAITNVLGILIGAGEFFAAFTCAILITALLSWKTEFVGFISKLTTIEIRGTLLMAFIAVVVYPLLPNNYIDPWHIINPQAIWLTVIIVAALNFVNYVLLRQFGARGIRYSAILGGLVNSAATSLLLGQEVKNDADLASSIAIDFMLSDVAMIVRNGALVAIFSWLAGPQASLAALIALGPMVLAASLIALILFLRSRQASPAPSQTMPLKSPLALRSVLEFGVLFFALTAIGGAAQRLLGALGFLVVAVLGALASAAASSVLIGSQVRMHFIGAQIAAITIYLATVFGLIENVVIFYSATRNRSLSLWLGLYSALIIVVGALAVGALVLFVPV
ncbi:MAG: DUF4010 domain-containing protein [Ktedonobacteraceae bacterium]